MGSSKSISSLSLVVTRSVYDKVVYLLLIRYATSYSQYLIAKIMQSSVSMEYLFELNLFMCISPLF